MKPSDELLEKYNQLIEENFPSTHVYAHTMAYILNAPHATLKDKKLWKPEEFYQMENALEYEIKRLLFNALRSDIMTETTTDLDFPTALKYCLEGKKITNSNWNGKDQYVFMMSGYPDGVPANIAMSGATGITEGTRIKVAPYLMLKNANGIFCNWIPSTGDLFSKSWEVV